MKQINKQNLGWIVAVVLLTGLLFSCSQESETDRTEVSEVKLGVEVVAAGFSTATRTNITTFGDGSYFTLVFRDANDTERRLKYSLSSGAWTLADPQTLPKIPMAATGKNHPAMAFGELITAGKAVQVGCYTPALDLSFSGDAATAKVVLRPNVMGIAVKVAGAYGESEDEMPEFTVSSSLSGDYTNNRPQADAAVYFEPYLTPLDDSPIGFSNTSYATLAPGQSVSAGEVFLTLQATNAGHPVYGGMEYTVLAPADGIAYTASTEGGRGDAGKLFTYTVKLGGSDVAEVVSVAVSDFPDGRPIGLRTYQGIMTAADLCMFADDWNAAYVPDDATLTETNQKTVIARWSDTGTEEGVIRLLKDIDMEGVDFTAIGGLNNAFTGVFDGNGHMIYNITGLFVESSGTVCNLRVRNNAPSDAICIAAVNGGRISACSIETSSGRRAFIVRKNTQSGYILSCIVAGGPDSHVYGETNSGTVTASHIFSASDGKTGPQKALAYYAVNPENIQEINNALRVQNEDYLMCWVSARGVMPFLSVASKLTEIERFCLWATNAENGWKHGINKNFTLREDIDLSGMNWIPIGEMGSMYTGTFDGNGKTITGLTIDENRAEVGLFGMISPDATVKNLTVANASVKSKRSEEGIGIIVGCSRGRILACAVKNGWVNGPEFLGTLVGRLSGGLLAGCTVENTLAIALVGGGGGIVGYLASGTVIGCRVVGVDVQANYSGGIAGGNNGGIISSYSGTPSLSGETYQGGVIALNDPRGTAIACRWKAKGDQTTAIGSDDNPIKQEVNCVRVTEAGLSDSDVSAMNVAIREYNAGVAPALQCNYHWTTAGIAAGAPGE